MPGSPAGEGPAGGRREGTPPPVFARSPRVLILSAAVGAGHVRAVARPFASRDIVDGMASLVLVAPSEGLPAFPALQPARDDRHSRRRPNRL